MRVPIFVMLIPLYVATAAPLFAAYPVLAANAHNLNVVIGNLPNERFDKFRPNIQGHDVARLRRSPLAHFCVHFFNSVRNLGSFSMTQTFKTIKHNCLSI